MIRLDETTRSLPFFAPIPLTPLPLIYHRDHLFPYTSYGSTAENPVPRTFRFLILENEFLRIEVAPELGGRIYSLFDKRIDRDILFCNPVVKPVRVLPIWAFISGGMEFNFPIAHSPTSIASVGCASGQEGAYGFVRVGEREARTGMEWAVELGLCEGCPALIQRTALRNQSGSDHPWMFWTIAAVPSTTGTEFVHPPHPVLVHDHQVSEIQWPGNGLNWERSIQQMTAFFWKPGGADYFGVFHHDLGCGLMHLANSNELPGKKVWTYGHGRHRRWGQATTAGSYSYAELESGPLTDQNQKAVLPANTERRFQEFWVPISARTAFHHTDPPNVQLPPWPHPWLGWKHSPWQTEWEQFRANAAPLPTSTVPTGLDLERPLDREWRNGSSRAAEPLALWLAFHKRPQEALSVLATQSKPRARRLTGLILWKALDQKSQAVPHLEAGPLTDPIAIVELDQLYAELGLTEKRAALLAYAPSHRLILERKADLALAQGKPEQTLRHLAAALWPREHQRYVRSELWTKAQVACGRPPSPVPGFLNEDNLAPFGAYWADD